jgi:Leucine-rich repeat (LRR) protein
VNLRELFLVANQIKVIEGLPPSLTVLDVSDNKIRAIQNVAHLKSLRLFHASKNKLTSLRGLESLHQLSLIAC